MVSPLLFPLFQIYRHEDNVRSSTMSSGTIPKNEEEELKMLEMVQEAMCIASSSTESDAVPSTLSPFDDTESDSLDIRTPARNVQKCGGRSPQSNHDDRHGKRRCNQNLIWKMIIIIARSWNLMGRERARATSLPSWDRPKALLNICKSPGYH
jgi:hypothetical protein